MIKLPQIPSINQQNRWRYTKGGYHRLRRFAEDLEFTVRVQRGEQGVPIWEPTHIRRRNAREGKFRRCTITRYSAGTLDHDNFVAACKILIDALVREGLIFDDSPEWLEVEYRQVKSKRGEGRTEVVVTG